MSENMNRITAQMKVYSERERQDVLWGIRHDLGHGPLEWSAILAKYVGKLSDIALDGKEEKPYERCLIEIGALAVAALEAYYALKFDGATNE